MSYTIRIIGLAQGVKTPFDEQYVQEYDPNRQGVDPLGFAMYCHLRTTPDINEAKQFSDMKAATEFWRQISERWPTRPDGRPNRPLTAFTTEISRSPAARAS